MRTTLRIDDDLLVAVKERARAEGRSAGDVFSDLVRKALKGDEPVGGRGRHGFDPFPHRGGLATNALVNELREDE